MNNSNFDGAYIISAILIFIFAVTSPVFFVSAAIIGFIVFLIYRAGGTVEVSLLASSRRTALNNVSLYLAPHNSIWRNLRVSNKYCILRLGADGKTITGSEKTNTTQYRKFRIVNSKIHSMSELWDIFCLNFDHLTSYDGLLDICNLFKAEYIEETLGSINKEGQIQLSPIKTDSVSYNEKLDINNASEVEITALPGISIVISKKLIKKREEIGGFKNIDDVFLFLKLKPHMENQLRNLICVKKMKGTVKVEKTEERRIDF